MRTNKSLCLTFFIGALLLASQAFAQPAVWEFLAELHAIESVQAQNPETPLSYDDPKHGQQLRTLLQADRVSPLIEAYLSTVKTKGTDDSDLPNRIKPILIRYGKAFAGNLGKYEREYLDSLQWTVLYLKKSTSMMSIAQPKQSDVPKDSPVSAVEIQKLLGSLSGLMQSVLQSTARGLQDQIDKGMFSQAGELRARQYVNTLMEGLPTPVQTQGKTLPTRRNGEDVYKHQCIACHSSGAAGSPILGDKQAWAPRIKQGLGQLWRSATQGKGAMGAQAGADLTTNEVGLAVIYIANASGAKFQVSDLSKITPPVPPQTQLIRSPFHQQLKQITYDRWNVEQQTQLGQRVYESNCAACHQSHGKGTGPIPSLSFPKSFTSQSSAITLVLRGSGGGVMPGWNQLSNEEIAVVINYITDKFGSDLLERVMPEDVQKGRE